MLFVALTFMLEIKDDVRKRSTHGGAADPRADDVLTRAEDINNRAEVRERSTSVSNGGSANGDDTGCAGRRSAPCINVGVSSGDLHRISSAEWRDCSLCAYGNVDTTVHKLNMVISQSKFRVVSEPTEVTALSRAVEAPPPRDREAMEGRPEAAADEATKLRPETLGETSVILPQRNKHDTYMSATLPELGHI